MKICSTTSLTEQRRSGVRVFRRHLVLFAATLACVALADAQVPIAEPAAPPLEPLTGLHFTPGPLTIRQPAIPNRPFTVTGIGGAILGMQDGTTELWQFPLKFFSGLHLRAEVDGYPVPIDLNSAAATLDVSPDHTTLTYSHAAITVRQHMFVPAGEGSLHADGGEGGVIVFEIESIHPATLIVSLAPAMVREWPAPQYGQPGWDWVRMGSGGAYAIGTDNPELFGLIGMPGAVSGVLSPYQEHPRTLPLEFRLHFDPVQDRGRFYPLLCEVNRAGERNNKLGQRALEERLAARDIALLTLWANTQSYYTHYFDTRLTVETPDPQFDRALAWAELAIDKMQVATSTGEVGLVAGWYPSFDSARPGFGWFFGRDTLWSMYAINSYGDAALTRRGLDFLIARQRADGKMMHEFSQTAALLTGVMSWSNLDYEYAAADSTPLYLLAMQDYIRATGDLAYLRRNWESLQKAYRFERTHDSDGDGVYDNSQGTGWVEGWPPKLPHQEMYLAALDRDATAAMAQLARWMGDAALGAEAQATFAKLGTSVDAYRLPDGTYAFSKNVDGTYDPTLTVYPAVALWGSAQGMAQPDAMLQAWSAHTFATDWGTRAVADTDRVYDPISYHQGTVWPLFTGWNAMAQYRTARPLAGYAALRENVDLTWAQDPGSVTEVLSGRFYEPLGRSSTHQLWSSAMVLAPALRGLFGLAPDALRHTLSVQPQLPALWDHAALHNVRVGDSRYDVAIARVGDHLEVTATGSAPGVLCLRAQPLTEAAPDCQDTPALRHSLRVPLPSVEVQLMDPATPELGDSTIGARVVGEQRTAHSLMLTVEAHPGSTVRFHVRTNGAGASMRPVADGGTLRDGILSVAMASAPDTPHTPTSDGSFLMQVVTLRW